LKLKEEDMEFTCPKKFNCIRIEDYRPFIGDETIERIKQKAAMLEGFHIANVNSTYYGGGVASLLSSLTLLMNSLGIRTGWRAIHGPPDFFTVTKRMHNALQGADIDFSAGELELFEQIVYENSLRNHFDHDVVVIHDPQPLPMIGHYRKTAPWVWRCHIDLSNPNKTLMQYLSSFIVKYDAMVISDEEYRQDIAVPQVIFPPAIDPFSITNKEMPADEIDARLKHYNIPVDLPIIVQISRFDLWKDPQGVIQAFKLAQKEVPATLVLLGNIATDDPEGEVVYRSLLEERAERILIISSQDGALVNAIQRRAAVVLQKSLREGFGLTVSEAMWKGTPVIGGNVGGIRRQIDDGVNGFLVNSVEQAAEKIVLLLKDNDLRKWMGQRAREKVRENFLLTRYMEQYFDLFGSFETVFKIKKAEGAGLKVA
jgi:trehalose synthase